MNKIPLTNQQKSARRNLALNEIARGLGFESWRKLETQIKRGNYQLVRAVDWAGKNEWETINKLLKTRADLASMVNSLALELLECDEISNNTRDQANEYLEFAIPLLDPTYEE